MKIAFIGGGNMATALIGGLYAKHSEIQIQVADPNPQVRQRLENEWPLTCFERATDAVQNMEVIVLAVKPQVLSTVLEELGSVLSDQQLVISIVAGIPIKQIASRLNSSPAIVRMMPNMPALIGLGITALFSSESCNDRQRDIAGEIIRAVGEVVWLQQENLMDVVTAVSGSGPAYFFLMMELLVNMAVKNGMNEKDARQLAVQTAVGSGLLAAQSEHSPEELRKMVTSKGGTTEAALNILNQKKFADLFYEALQAALDRGKQLSQ